MARSAERERERVQERSLPTEEQVRQWIESPEGRLTFRTIWGIYYYQHLATSALEEVYGEEVKEDLPKYNGWKMEQYANALVLGQPVDPQFLEPDKLERLKARFPIDDIHNATYVPEADILVLSTTDTFLFPRGWELGPKLQRIEERRPGESRHILAGVTARVKSNGWKIYDTVGSTSPEGIRLAPPLLAARGYVMLHRVGERMQGDRWIQL